MSLLLQWIAYGITGAVDGYFLSLYLVLLSLTLRSDERADDADSGACGDLLEKLGVSLGLVNDDLYVVYGRAIVERNEADSLVASLGAYPSLDTDGLGELTLSKLGKLLDSSAW